MFGVDVIILAFVLLVTISIGAVAYMFLFARIANETKTSKRFNNIKFKNRGNAAPSAGRRVVDVSKRRKTIQDSLKEVEDAQKKKHKHRKSPRLKDMLQQAGLRISMRKYVLVCVAAAVIFALVAYLIKMPLYAVLVAAIVGGLGFPRWLVGFIRKRRMKKFIAEFANAIDVIVRGIKAGLPINDCIAIIAKEAEEPVKSEFQIIIESQQMGMPLGQAVQRLYENVPLAETNFFAIVITIHQSVGGNLSEALSNLSNVLRDRKKMSAKIVAMSTEAKASGMIIGSLPIVVGFLVYITTPDYIMTLFTHPTGNLVLLCSAIWMGIGIFVMKKMISFDF